KIIPQAQSHVDLADRGQPLSARTVCALAPSLPLIWYCRTPHQNARQGKRDMSARSDGACAPPYTNLSFPISFGTLLRAMVTSQVVLKRQRIISALAILSRGGSRNLWGMIRNKNRGVEFGFCSLA